MLIGSCGDAASCRHGRISNRHVSARWTRGRGSTGGRTPVPHSNHTPPPPQAASRPVVRPHQSNKPDFGRQSYPGTARIDLVCERVKTCCLFKDTSNGRAFTFPFCMLLLSVGVISIPTANRKSFNISTRCPHSSE